MPAAARTLPASARRTGHVGHRMRASHSTMTLRPGSCRPWVAIDRSDLTIPGGGRARFRFEVTPPADAPTGECRFALMIEGDEPAVARRRCLPHPGTRPARRHRVRRGWRSGTEARNRQGSTSPRPAANGSRRLVVRNTEMRTVGSVDFWPAPTHWGATSSSRPPRSQSCPAKRERSSAAQTSPTNPSMWCSPSRSRHARMGGPACHSNTDSSDSPMGRRAARPSS